MRFATSMTLSLVAILSCAQPWLSVAAAEDTPAAPATPAAPPATPAPPGSGLPVKPAPSAPTTVPGKDASKTLTLEQAIASASNLNDTREVAAARIVQADAARRQALSGFLPTLAASGQLEKYSVSNAPFAHYVGDANGLVVNLTLTLFNATNADLILAANTTLAAQHLDSGDVRRVLAFQVASSFLTEIAAEKVLTAAIEARDVAQQTLDQTAARAKVGVATGNDVARSQLTVATAELTVTQDRQSIIAARFSLGDLIGREVTEQLVEPELAIVPSRVIAEMEQIGLQERPDLASGALRIRATNLQAQGTRLGILPVIGVRGSYLLNAQTPPIPIPDSPEWQVAASATWVLYDGGNREATVDLLDAQAHEAFANLHQAKRDMYRDLGTALGALDAAEISVRQATTALNVAKVNESETLTRYRQGLDTALDAADATAQVYQAESDLTARELDLRSSRFQLRQLVGRWPLSRTIPPQLLEVVPRHY